MTIWKSKAPTNFPICGLPDSAEFVIVGAGITGLTLAHELLDRGEQPILIDSGNPGEGTTTHSSAHLSSLFDSQYDHTAAVFSDEDNAKVAVALALAIDQIEENTSIFGNPCDFARIEGYYFAHNGEEGVERVRAEQHAASVAGLTVRPDPGFLLPFNAPASFAVANQARFNPAEYIAMLSKAYCQRGGVFCPNTRVMDYETGSSPKLITNDSNVSFGKLIMATHTPLGRQVEHTELKAMRSYLVAFELKSDVPDILGWDSAEPYHYFRRIERGAKPPLLLVGGADHPTGKQPVDRVPWQVLTSWARERFDLGKEVAHWSAQYYEPADGYPYIGPSIRNSDILIATGYNGDGLTWGTAAGSILADCLTGVEHPLADVVTPRRIKAAAFPRIAEMGLKTLKSWVSFTGAKQFTPQGSGKVEDNCAIFTDAHTGEVVRLNARCPHSGCIVAWNNLEKTWDCPCHGGRFTCHGERIEGPPCSGLARE